MHPVKPFIDTFGAFGPWLLLALFIVSSILMIWRLEHMTETGVEGTVLGTLVNAILNDPGPLSVHDHEMEERLAGCLLLLLQAEMAAGRAAASARKMRRRRK